MGLLCFSWPEGKARVTLFPLNSLTEGNGCQTNPWSEQGKKMFQGLGAKMDGLKQGMLPRRYKSWVESWVLFVWPLRV